uniref:Conjugal transfer protein TraA n=1 Tax=Aeromonas sp. Ne-1 TaxID=1675689 RepID=A0A0H4J952_9GAMM|nr:MobQ family relaxase [Aeromonas sp. Ne-1]AKO69670.1 conjugal transfer protein TraA [Aeromonas sp. Ne-1]
MSLFYMTVRNINKSTQSAVASASYRSGTALYSERDEETKSYGTRTVQPDSFILAPEHAPEWVNNREQLWNEVEKVEKNWNSRLAREVLVALPVELTNDQQKQLVTEYAKENFVDEGMVADISIHRDRNENPHAHIMLTVRPFNEDGTWGNKRKKVPKMVNGEVVLKENGNPEMVSIHLTNWNDKETLQNWRKNLAEKINEFYQELGFNERVSHESYEKQGLDIIPKQRLTREEYAVEEKAKKEAIENGTEYVAKTYYGKVNQEIEQVNQEIKAIKNQIEREQNKVVSLSDYREAREDSLLDKLNKVRKDIPLSSEDWKSIKIVANRVGGFIDYKSAKDNVVKLDNWNKNLNRQMLLLEAEKNTLLKAKDMYLKEPSKTLLYGFIPSQFKEQYQEKVDNYKEKKAKLDNSIEVFNELYERSKRVVDIQKEFAIEEFNYLYPNYSHIPNDSDEIIEQKGKYVQEFRESAIVNKNLPMFDSGMNKFDSKHIKLNSLIKNWKETNHSLVIAERTKNKYKKEYNENYKKYNGKDIYVSSVKYEGAKITLSNLEKEKEALQGKLLEEMITRYPNTKQELIESIPSKIQSQVLELHLNGEQSGILSKDLEKVKTNNLNQYKNKDVDKDKNKNDFVQNESSNVSNDIGSLLDSLIKATKENETEDEKHKKKKNKPRKLRDLDNEL